MSERVIEKPSQRRNVTILVVDDEPCLRYMVTRWLSGEGYHCVEAEDADSAWDYLQHHPVHLVTLDINMPGMPGSELLVRIKEHLPETEVVMLTARAEAEMAIKLLILGASGYLIKPVNHEELIFQVARALERRQLYMERRRYTEDLERKVREQTLAIRRAHEETIHRLINASAYRDEETGSHIKRVGLASAALAETIGWPSEAVDHLRMAASMHDVGKIGIPDAILQKPGGLTREEFGVMKTHTVIGARMLAKAESPMLRMAHDIALAHHERWDGQGYPNGVAGEAIAQAARIVSVADVYDALTHDRVYRPAIAEPDALQMMLEGRGSQFDPSLLDAFFDIVPLVQKIAREHPDEDAAAGSQPSPAFDYDTASPGEFPLVLS